MDLPFDPGAWGDVGWLLAFLVSTGYGLVGAVVPILNAEAFAVAAGALDAGVAVAAIGGLTLGQSVGKMMVFWAVRRGREMRFFRRWTSSAIRDAEHARRTGPDPGTDTRGTWRRRWDAAVAFCLRWVADPHWGLPLVLAASVVGFPPLYLVVVVAGASRLPAWGFAATMTIGRGARFVLLAWGGLGLAAWLA